MLDRMNRIYISLLFDGHPIFDVNTGEQINIGGEIIIGEHVWIGLNATILKGSEIGSGSIIGANSLVTKKFPNNCSIGGVPAKITRENIAWTRKETDIEKIEKKYVNKTKSI